MDNSLLFAHFLHFLQFFVSNLCKVLFVNRTTLPHQRSFNLRITFMLLTNTQTPRQSDKQTKATAAAPSV